MPKVWYATSGKRYNEEGEPDFFNPQDFNWAIEVENHWQDIKPELENLVRETDKEFTSNSYVGLTKDNSWSSYTFLFWKIKVKKMRLSDKCPVLFNYLKEVPGLVSLSLSRISPYTIISEHRGDTNAVMRCHLGIEIPAGLPSCGLRAGKEQQGWEEGKWLFFNDAFKHSAWNNTDKRRIVIIMDVIRPEFLYKERRICANIRTRDAFRHLQNKYGIIRKLGFWVKVPCVAFIYVYTYLAHNQNL